MEMFGLSRPTMNFCWYIPYYILMMLILPVFAKFENKSPLTNIVLPLAIILVLFELGCKIPNMDIIYTFSYIYEYGPIMLSGYLFAHYNLFDYLQEKFDKIFIFKQLRVIICVILAFAIPASKYFIRSFSLAATIPLLSKTSLFLSYDIVSTPLFIFVLVNIINVANTKYIKMGLIELGKLSALMWFVSCAFYDNCYTIFQPILYIPHNPVLVLIWGTILCFIPAYLINMMLQFIIKKSSNITIK